MQTIFTGINENDGTSVSFRYRDMLNEEFTSEYLKDPQELARILACNVEYPTVREDGTVEICRRNFNDGFADMMAELCGEDDEDEDSDD